MLSTTKIKYIAFPIPILSQPESDHTIEEDHRVGDVPYSLLDILVKLLNCYNRGNEELNWSYL